MRDDYRGRRRQPPEVEVGSPEFLVLIAESPEIADAATLGERVVTEGPDGWITIVWPKRVARTPGCTAGRHDDRRGPGGSGGRSVSQPIEP